MLKLPIQSHDSVTLPIIAVIDRQESTQERSPYTAIYADITRYALLLDNMHYYFSWLHQPANSIRNPWTCVIDIMTRLILLYWVGHCNINIYTRLCVCVITISRQVIDKNNKFSITGREKRCKNLRKKSEYMEKAVPWIWEHVTHHILFILSNAEV